VYKIDSPNELPKRIPIPKDLPTLLKQATEVLGMRRPAVQLYDEQNKPISAITDVQPEMNLFVAAVRPASDSWEEPIFKSRLPRELSSKSSKVITQPRPKPRPENAVQHQAIAASRLTAKENLRDALLSLYAGLTPEHKAHLPISGALQKLAEETQQFSVDDAMQSQFIGPSTVITQTDLGQQTVSWVLAALKGPKPEDCRFVITGPSQSGKSTLLSLFVSLFYQKLQVASDAGSYLVVPFNWYFHEMYLVDISKLFEIIVSATLNALRVARMELIPIVHVLHQWLVSLLTIPTFPSLMIPQSKKADPVWYRGMVDIGRRIHRYWNKKDTSWAETAVVKSKIREDNNFSLFLNEVCAFPQRISRVFEFKSAVLVYDHFDVSSFLLEPGEHFPESNEPVSLFAALWNGARDGPFFIASRSDEALLGLFREFDIEDYRQLSTERLIDQREGRELVIPQLELALNVNMCRGCPAYLALYERVVELAKESQERAAVKSQFSRLKSVVDISRNEMLRQELVRLAVLLANADTDGNFDEEKVNGLMALTDLTVKVH
jgi:hypothetical protein